MRRVAPEEVEALRLLPTAAILRALGVRPWTLPGLTRDLRALKAEAAAAGTIPLFPGVPEMLRDLAAAGIGLAIASSDSEASIRATLGPAGAPVGRIAAGAALFGKPAKLRRLLRESGVPAAAALYVGDETRDAEAAAEAGMGFGAVTWGLCRAGGATGAAAGAGVRDARGDRRKLGEGNLFPPQTPPFLSVSLAAAAQRVPTSRNR
ncbi:HAD hydrolase-like protein [Dankookia sp. P2]|uniref:HAD hydrolase-like protein n=1 Tax=Dankookia sp. P2 TaxID=3423955 RepID=UPI003D678E55